MTTDPKPMSEERLAEIKHKLHMAMIHSVGLDGTNTVSYRGPILADAEELLAEVHRLRTEAAGNVIFRKTLNAAWQNKVERLRAREKVLHDLVRRKCVILSEDLFMCMQCGQADALPERHALVDGQPCPAAPMEDQG